MIEIKINSNEAGQRLDKMLSKFLKDAPTGFIYKMLRKKNITLNGKKAKGDEKVQEGDLVKLFLSEETVAKFKGKAAAGPVPDFDITAGIIYEDGDIILYNKPAGMLSQKSAGGDLSLNEYLLNYCMQAGDKEEYRSFTPSVCNRLDRNTSGLITFGKTLAGSQFLSKCFKDRTAHKFYLAIVHGLTEESGVIKGFLTKDTGTNKVSLTDKETPGSSPVHTEYKRLECNDKYSLLEIELFTGKTHQIRAHMAGTGHPLVGDVKYGDRKQPVRHLMLHSYRLVLPDGREYTAEEPEHFRTFLRKENLTWHGRPEA